MKALKLPWSSLLPCGMNLLILKLEKNKKQNKAKDMIEVMAELKAMIELLKGFMSWFPSELHLDINFLTTW